MDDLGGMTGREFGQAGDHQDDGAQRLRVVRRAAAPPSGAQSRLTDYCPPLATALPRLSPCTPAKEVRSPAGCDRFYEPSVKGLPPRYRSTEPSDRLALAVQGAREELALTELRGAVTLLRVTRPGGASSEHLRRPPAAGQSHRRVGIFTVDGGVPRTHKARYYLGAAAPPLRGSQAGRALARPPSTERAPGG